MFLLGFARKLFQTNEKQVLLPKLKIWGQRFKTNLLNRVDSLLTYHSYLWFCFHPNHSLEILAWTRCCPVSTLPPPPPRQTRPHDPWNPQSAWHSERGKKKFLFSFYSSLFSFLMKHITDMFLRKPKPTTTKDKVPQNKPSKRQTYQRIWCSTNVGLYSSGFKLWSWEP